jgi:hypothetical protein
MSRITKYQDSICKFIKTKSSFVELTQNTENDMILLLNEHESSIFLLTIFSGQKKKKKFKSHEAYNIASGVDLMMTVCMLNDNIEYYNDNYGETNVKNFLSQSPFFISECLSKNLETLENIMDKNKVSKMQTKLFSYLNKKMIGISKFEKIYGKDKPHKTDLIKFNFENKNIIESKYRKLKIIDKNVLLEYVNRTYGSACQCSFVFGWLLGMGDEKYIPNLEKLGLQLGLIIKLSHDFKNLEKNIESSKESSFNMIVNCGIYECFELFDQNKTGLIEGCMLMDIYSVTVKEIIDYVEKKFDICLKNSDLELNSRYTSFSTGN